MHIKRVKLVHFRNYEILNLSGLSKGVNIIFGKNAQGKTNLIEAINICANGKSFRVQSDSKTIMHDCSSAYILTDYAKSNGKNTIEALIEKNRKKSFKLNGIPLRSIREMLGNLYVVVFSPEDIKMAKESPAMRRAFLDGEISKIRPSYVDALKKYTQIIAQKNAVLRRRNMKDAPAVLRAYNEQLKGYIKVILKNRHAYVHKLNEYVEKTHALISGGEEKIEISYRTTIREEDIAGQLERQLEREIHELGCFAGPHRDDMEIRLNGREIRSFASQGQLRTLILGIKIACLKILEDSTGHRPILLLDDVFSELDDTRKHKLLESIQEIQTFITTADEMDLARVPGAHIIHIAAGTIVQS